MIPLPKALKRFLNFFVFFEWAARRSGRGGEGKTTHTGGPFAATPNPSRGADTQRVIRHGWRANVFGGIALRSGLRGLHWRLGSLAFVMCVVASTTYAGSFQTLAYPRDATTNYPIIVRSGFTSVDAAADCCFQGAVSRLRSDVQSAHQRSPHSLAAAAEEGRLKPVVSPLFC